MDGKQLIKNAYAANPDDANTALAIQFGVIPGNKQKSEREPTGVCTWSSAEQHDEQKSASAARGRASKADGDAFERYLKDYHRALALQYVPSYHILST